jgi:hypothetical protein
MTPHAGLERRVIAAIEATPPRIPVLLGGCGTGRTTALHGISERIGRGACQYIDVERSASTPERFFHAISASSPFQPSREASPVKSARDAFDQVLAYLTQAPRSCSTKCWSSGPSRAFLACGTSFAS